jgi:hypothetical protein
MKTPFHGEFSIIESGVPDSFYQKMTQERSSQFIRIALSEPIRQIGHNFLHIVLRVEIAADRKLKQCGCGVLCQTEEEAMESMELLSSAAKQQICITQAAGVGMVGRATNIRHIIIEHSVQTRLGNLGKREWWALEREIDKATGEVNVKRHKDATNEAEAKDITRQWLQELEREKKNYFDAIKKADTPLLPPSRCDPLTQIDLKNDLPEAKWTALKRQWPKCFEIFEARKANPNCQISDQACQDAYLLDLVAQGYDPKADTIRGDLQLISALHKAANKFAKAGNRKVRDAAIYLIAFNWELGWCYLSDAQIAGKVADILKTPFTPGQITQFRSRTLGLVAKHWPGQPAKVQ